MRKTRKREINFMNKIAPPAKKHMSCRSVHSAGIWPFSSVFPCSIVPDRSLIRWCSPTTNTLCWRGCAPPVQPATRSLGKDFGNSGGEVICSQTGSFLFEEKAMTENYSKLSSLCEQIDPQKLVGGVFRHLRYCLPKMITWLKEDPSFVDASFSIKKRGDFSLLR